MTEKSVKKNFVINIIYQIALILFSLIVIPYVSRVLGEDGIGKYSFANTLNTYFLIISSLGFSTYAKREIAKSRNDKYKQCKIFWEVNICRGLFVCLIFIIDLILIFCGVFGKYTNLMLILSLYLVSVALDISFFFYGNEEFGKVISLNLIIKTIGTVFIFIFVKQPSHVWLYALINCLISFFSILFAWFFLKKKLVKVRFSELRPFRHLKGTLILYIPSLALSLYNLIDNSLIGFITQSDAENGYYMQSEKIVKKILLVVNCLSVVMLPRNTHEISCGNLNKAKENIYNSLACIWLFGLPMTGGIIFAANNFIPWFLGASFNKSILLLQVLSALIIFIGASTVIGEQYLLPNRKDKHYVWAIIIGVVVSLLVNIPLIYCLGSLGAALTTAIAEFVILLIMLCMVAKELSLKRIFKSFVKPFVATLIMCLVIAPLSVVLSPSIPNTLLIIACGVLVYAVSILLLRDSLVINSLRGIKNKFSNKSKSSTEPIIIENFAQSPDTSADE